MDLAVLKTSAGRAAVSAHVDNVKWLAIVAMVVDHVNTYILHAQVGWMYAVGRVAFPCFVGVLGYKLARCSTQAKGRVLLRLATSGALATPAFIALGHESLAKGWWPLNVIWTLAIVTALTWLLEAPAHGAIRALVGVPLFLLGGAFGEFWWPGIGIGLSVWALAKRPRSVTAIAGLLISAAALCWINGNAWALAAAPCAAIAVRLPPLPAWQLAFYAFYPAHLLGLWLWRTMLGS